MVAPLADGQFGQRNAFFKGGVSSAGAPSIEDGRSRRILRSSRCPGMAPPISSAKVR
jgi:hypothetical protein